MENDTIRLVTTKKGHPALWEEGGGYTNTGGCIIVCNSDGSKKSPIFVRTGGHLACAEHALFSVSVGDVIIYVDRHHRDLQITVKQIISITKDDAGYLAEVKSLGSYSEGQWDNDDTEKKFSDAIKAAISKSYCYHCRESHYSL